MKFKHLTTPYILSRGHLSYACGRKRSVVKRALLLESNAVIDLRNFFFLTETWLCLQDYMREIKHTSLNRVILRIR